VFDFTYILQFPEPSSQEWYGWHFPEMAKIISDNLAYAKVIRAMGKFPKPQIPRPT
jgi:RNA processing factor Prp31